MGTELVTNWDVTQSMVPPSHTTTDAFHSRHREVARRKHRKNYECSPGCCLLTASHFPSVLRLDFLILLGIVNCVTKSLNHFIAPNAFVLSLSRVFVFLWVILIMSSSFSSTTRKVTCFYGSSALCRVLQTLNSKVT